MNKKLYYGIITVLVIGILVIFSMIGLASEEASKTPPLIIKAPLIKASPTGLEAGITKMELYNETKDSWITIHKGSTYKVDFVKNEGAIEKGMRRYLKGKPLPKGTYTKIRTAVTGRGEKDTKAVSRFGKTYHTAPWIKFVKDDQNIPCVAAGIAIKLGEYPPPIYNDDTPAARERFEMMKKKLYKKTVFDTPFYKREMKKDSASVTFTFREPFIITNPEQDTPKLKIKFDFKDMLLVDMKNKICWPVSATKCYATVVTFSTIGLASEEASKAPPSIIKAPLIKATPTAIEEDITKVELYNETKDSWITIHEGYTCKVDLMKNEGLGVVEKVMRTYLKDKPLPAGTYTKIRATIDRKRMEELKTVSYRDETYHIAPWIKFVNDSQNIPCIAPGIAMRLGNYPPPIYNDDTPEAKEKFEKMKEKLYKNGVFETPFFKMVRPKGSEIVTFIFPEPFIITNPEQDTPKLKIKFDFKDILCIDMKNKIGWSVGAPKCYAIVEE